MEIGIRAAAWITGALVAATFVDDGWAGRSGGHGGRSAAAGASHYGGYHGHHHHSHFGHGGAFFVGGTYWPYFPPPYYYGPDYSVPQYEPPSVYVERFDGTPTPDTQDEIFCPAAGAYYPDVQECPGGWQRVIRPES